MFLLEIDFVGVRVFIRRAWVVGGEAQRRRM